jgi:broad specificity phosphatase PhoE
MELYLIRHGQSTNNRGDARVPDPPLTELGKQQADRAGRALRNLSITHLYCSAMLRAVQTAAIVGGHLKLPPHVFVSIHEWGGIWKDRVDGGRVQLPGLTRSQLRDVCPTAVLPDDVTDEGWCIQAFDAHELAQEGNDEQMLGLAHENCLRFIAHLDHHHHHAREHEKVEAILHGGSGSILLGAFFGLLPNETQNRFPHNNAGITKILRTPKYTQLLYQNQTSHLLKESEFDLEASSPMVIW